MKKELFQKCSLFFVIIIVLVVSMHCKDSQVESDYFTPKVLATHFNGEQFVGSETCRECHQDIYNSHLQTAHFNSSAPASADNIKGSFDAGSNHLGLDVVEFTMKADKGLFYQYMRPKFGMGEESAQKIDMVVGSGVKGQSYLSWDKDRLYQLQVSYYTPANNWINSPNFPNYNTNRPVSDACLKCHFTFAKNHDVSGNGNQYTIENMIYGVDCERCHRPSAKHVTYHRANPGLATPKFMIRSDTLSRQQRLDACVQCHSGLRAQQLKGNPFSFVTGENLDEYAKNYYSNRPNTELDVHGNQYGLLTSSKCFKESAKLDCTTCHDPHKNQRGDTTSFNQKCISCHNNAIQECKAPTANTGLMGNNCIACHMPLSPSRSMKVQLAKDSAEVPVYIRTHLIGIYEKAAIMEN